MTDDIIIDKANISDVPTIVTLLADDPFGGVREVLEATPTYGAAFEMVAADPNSEILVARDEDGAVVGCLQLTVIPGLSYRGVLRCQIEDVRVSMARRNAGIGAKLMAAAEERARARGCGLIQLFVHGDREAAHQFYERLGFTGAHRGFRKSL